MPPRLRFLQKLETISERIPDECSLAAIENRVMDDLDALFLAALNDRWQVADQKSGVGFGRGMEIPLDPEMNLDLGAFKPTTASPGKIGWLGYLWQPQQITIEFSRPILLARWHRKLYVVDTDDGHQGVLLRFPMLPETGNHRFLAAGRRRCQPQKASYGELLTR